MERKADLKQHVCIHWAMMHSHCVNNNNKENGVDWEALLKTAAYFQAHSIKQKATVNYM